MLSTKGCLKKGRQILLAIHNCLICRQLSETLICPYCQVDLPLFHQQQKSANLLLWPEIKRGLSQINFDQLYALADYRWPLSQLLTGLKFQARLPHAKALAELFVGHALGTDFKRPQAIVPMPLHNNRFLMRKYNQSIIIGKHLQTLLSIPLLTDTLIKSKATLAQTGLSAAKRKANLQHAFELSETASNSLGDLQHIALFDDVVTTGATANSAYKCLNLAFPHLHIQVWSICLTLTHR
jgi:ComF family protein